MRRIGGASPTLQLQLTGFGMDIPRKSRKIRRIVIRVIIAVVTLVAIAAITLGLSRLEPAAPSVERQTLLIDGVKRGDIILEVRGVGTLVSEDMLVVPAEVSGRATRILVEAGTPVEPNTVILELSNPELQLSWLDAQSQLNSALARRKWHHHWDRRHDARRDRGQTG